MAIEGLADNDTHDMETAHVVQEKKAVLGLASADKTAADQAPAPEDMEQVREMLEVSCSAVMF